MAFSLDRDQASRRLGVSSRTIDRHIQAGRIRTRRIGKKMYLEEDDIETLRMADPARREEDYIVIHDDTPEREIPEIVTKEMQITDPKQTNMALSEIVRIYEDAQEQIARKDATIQELSYKLGKAEVELSNSIPALEYKKNTFLLESAKSKSDHDTDTLSKKIILLENEVGKRNSAIITLVILFILVLGFSVIFVLFGNNLSLKVGNNITLPNESSSSSLVKPSSESNDTGSIQNSLPI
ncbi:helix-turn-helix domain-containing protein [Candidatus Gracilibacteria bacterium]|nr:helix-turn-helix domain-containing protein [Candidatus Gracilibacteria bacterium]